MVYNISLIHQIFIVLISVFSLFLAFWVYFSNRESKVNRLFFWLGIAIFFWIILCYFGNTSTDPKLTSFLGKLAYGETALFFIPLYFFFIHLLKEEKKFVALNIFVLVSFVPLSFLSTFTNLMVKGVEFTEFGAMPIFGKWKFIYFGLVTFISIFIISRLLVNYFRFQKKEKLKIQYFLFGILPWTFLNLIFNVFFPLLEKIPRYYYIGNYSAIFLLGFTAYAIVKRELFEIRVVLTTLLVGLIAILLALDALVFTETFSFQVIKGIILVIFLFFGYSLIKSVLKEIELRKQLEEAYLKLQKLDKAKSEFISIASHQLRTPLTAIKGYISMLLEGTYGKLSRNAKEPMENVYKSSERLIRLVNDLLSVSRIETGKIELATEKVSLENIISSVVEEFKNEAEKKGFYLKWEKPTKPLPELLADPDKLRQVILNIVDNGVKYTKEGGITIKTKIKDQSLLTEISDTGEGMTAEELSKIFGIFSRGKAGLRFWTEGAGLGLYIAKKFVEMHQGKIWAESKGKGKGSTFYIELPMK